MAKKIKKTKAKPSLAKDIRASWQEALKYAHGQNADVIVHRVTPRDTDAREARMKLGLSQREFAALIGTGVGTVRKWELGTVALGRSAYADRSHQDRTESRSSRFGEIQFGRLICHPGQRNRYDGCPRGD